MKEEEGEWEREGGIEGEERNREMKRWSGSERRGE